MQVHRICPIVGHPPCFALWCFKVVHDRKKKLELPIQNPPLCVTQYSTEKTNQVQLFSLQELRLLKNTLQKKTYIYKYLSEQIDTNSTCNQIEAKSYTEIASFNIFQCRQSQGHCLISMRAFHEDIPDLSHSPCEGQLRQWYAMRMYDLWFMTCKYYTQSSKRHKHRGLCNPALVDTAVML